MTKIAQRLQNCGDKDSTKTPEETKATKAEEVTIVEITTEETTTVKPTATETKEPTAATTTEEPTVTTTTEPTTTTTIVPTITEKKEKIVYITDTGKKYHTGSCRFVKDSKISITIQEALSQGYEPCGVCYPDR